MNVDEWERVKSENIALQNLVAEKDIQLSSLIETVKGNQAEINSLRLEIEELRNRAAEHNKHNDSSSNPLSSSSGLPPLVAPVELLKKTADFPKEYTLARKPITLREFTNIFDSESKLVWITEETFISEEISLDSGSVLGYRNRQYCLVIREPPYDISLCIHSTSDDEARTWLKFLLALPDTYFEEVKIVGKFWSYTDGRAIEDDLDIFDWNEDYLEQVLQLNPKRRICFMYVSFQEEQCPVLAGGGTRTNLLFNKCHFCGSNSFLDGSTARQDRSAGVAHLAFSGDLALPEPELMKFLHLHNLKGLSLRSVPLSKKLYKAITMTNLKHITLYVGDDTYEFPDGGKALIKCVRRGRGLQSLEVETSSFGNNPEKLAAFVNALPHCKSLRHICISGMAAANHAKNLLEHSGLTHVGVPRANFDESCWNEFLQAVGSHANLRTLNLHDIQFQRSKTFDENTAHESLISMVQTNTHIEEIEQTRDKKSFGLMWWEEKIQPTLQCNRYRRMFLSFRQEVISTRTRAALVARGLETLLGCYEPSLVWMFLAQNCEVLLTYNNTAAILLEEDDQLGMDRRKRQCLRSCGKE